MNSFRKLNVYVKAKELVKQVYILLKKFPREEQYALCDQLRRAVISVPSNLAEGSGRQSDKDQAHFYTIAYGSLMETFSQLDVACDLGYISQEEFCQCLPDLSQRDNLKRKRPLNYRASSSKLK